MMRQRSGVSLVEVLIAIVIMLIAAIGTLTYFALGLGGVNKQGNRRAALERARQRIEQVLAAPTDTLPLDGRRHWCRQGNPCTSWVLSDVPVTQPVAVDDLPDQRMETLVQWVDDPASLTPAPDALSVGVKVWFTSNPADDDFNRVHLRALRTP
jgi:prepilin-type N-terminal cleavage/methylation domain-containing protein